MATYYDNERKTWYVKFRYTDWKGESKSTCKRGFKTKKEALAYEQTKKQSAISPTITLNELAQIYIKDYKVHYKHSSYLSTEKNLRIYILPYMGHMGIDKITPLTIRKWQTEMMDKNLSDATLLTISTTLSKVLNFAVKFYNLPSNPVRIAGKIGRNHSREVFLEFDEWKKVNDIITNKVDKTTFNILYWGGLRIGELLGLTLDDIDFNKNTLNINKQLTPFKASISVKSANSERVVTLPQAVMDLIKDYIASHHTLHKNLFYEYTRPTLNKHLRKYCELAGVQVVSLHGLRHSHASYLIGQGIPPNAIAKRLGHTTEMLLKIYAHCYKQSDNDIADMLNKNVGQM